VICASLIGAGVQVDGLVLFPLLIDRITTSP
jgi:hypothetical protein